MGKAFTKITKESLSSVRINLTIDGNSLLEKVSKIINQNDEIKTLWKIMNVNAIDRLGMSDHGPTHFNIVANNGIRLARMFEGSLKMSVVSDFGLTNDHAEVIIFLACIMHDLGISIHRQGHEEFSLFIARDMLKEILSFLPIEERMVVISETLHSIISHRSNGKPLTKEAGIVRIADALDMGKGRSRISYKRGEINIFSVSDMAIEKVLIIKGKNRPVRIEVDLENPAGIFQIDDLMQEKIKGSGLEKHIEVCAYVSDDNQRKLFKEFVF